MNLSRLSRFLFATVFIVLFTKNKTISKLLEMMQMLVDSFGHESIWMLLMFMMVIFDLS